MSPLGLPEGSVRAILAVLLVGACVGLSIAGTLAPDKLFELATVVVAFYFASRASTPQDGRKP